MFIAKQTHYLSLCLEHYLKHRTKLKPILLDLGFYDKSNLKLTLEGKLFRLKTGCQWRDIPNYFGKPNTLYRNFRYWVKTGKLTYFFIGYAMNRIGSGCLLTACISIDCVI